MALTSSLVVGVKAPLECWPIAVDRVRYVGEPVAIVVASDRYRAEDAVDLIEMRYRPLPAVVDPVARGGLALHRRSDDGSGNNQGKMVRSRSASHGRRNCIEVRINRWRDEEMQSLETQLRDLANADVRIQIERWKQQHEQEIRLDAIQRSSAVTRGKVTEHIVPYLPGFDLDPKDIRFLGTPIDLIAFKGLNGSEEIEIVFIEVKTGRSVLSARERAVKKAVEEKKVSWRVFNPDLEIDHQRIPTTSKGSPLGVQS